MRVFAEYFIGEDGKEYRRKTLLHFGNSANLIGSAVLMNPGSAKAVGEPDNDFLKKFFAEVHNEDVDVNSWRTFNPDSTMGQVEKIFNRWYLQKDNTIKLDGVIQLFNCFYYKNQHYNEAINNFDIDSEYKFNEYQYLKDKPVYLGWGGAGKYELRPIATEIFKKIDKSITPIYDKDFDNNAFYHPGYINRSYSKENTRRILNDFMSLFDK